MAREESPLFFLPPLPDDDDDLVGPQQEVKKARRMPSPSTIRVLANADNAINEANRDIEAFKNKRNIDDITQEGVGEEQMNLPPAWDRNADDDDDDDGYDGF